ncbi:diacylglycerol kinase [Oceanithermus sp.]
MKKLRRAFSFAWQGLAHTWRTQPNFRIEAAIGLLALSLAIWLGVGLVPVLLLILVVLSLELLNTAIEAVCDIAASEPHPLAKTAKDAAAAAVLLAAVISVIIGAIIFLPALVEKLRAYGKIS